MASLNAWKTKSDRKPLILKGARQVGKTWLLKEFGKRAYEDFAYVRLEDNAVMEQLFAGSLEPRRLLEGISAALGKPIAPQKTLLILDEVQAIPRALTALKYFNEDMPEYHIAVAGSLLGIAQHRGISFPVGNVNFLELHPLSFTEFLHAYGEGALVAFLDDRNFDMITTFKERFTDLLHWFQLWGDQKWCARTQL
jgi:predicted AAA+ superfamily ATPase